MLKDFLGPLIPLATFIAFMVGMKALDILMHWPTH